jgi:hypothetical protein
MFDYILTPFTFTYKYFIVAPVTFTCKYFIVAPIKLTYNFFYYDILGNVKPRRYRRRFLRLWVPRDHPLWHSLSKYQRFPRPRWNVWSRYDFGHDPINVVYNFIVLKFQYEQFYLRRILWKKALRNEWRLMKRVFRKRRNYQLIMAKLDVTTLPYTLKFYAIPMLINALYFLIIFPLITFYNLWDFKNYFRKNIIHESINIMFRLIERAISIKLHKYLNIFESPYFRFGLIPLKYFKYYIGTPLYNYIVKLIILTYNLIIYYLFSNKVVYLIMEIFHKPFLFGCVCFTKFSFFVLNKLKLFIIIKSIYYFILNLFLFKKINYSFLLELKNKKLYSFKQLSQDYLRSYNLITFSYNYYIYFWFEYIIYSIIASFYYIIFLYQNNIGYPKLFVRNWVDYLRLYSYSLVLYVIFGQFYKSFFVSWDNLVKNYRSTYIFLFGLGSYNTYFYLFIKYLAIYTLKTIIAFFCLLFFDCYAFYFFGYVLILKPIIRRLVRLFMKYVYEPCYWFFIPYPLDFYSHRYAYLALCAYSTLRYDYDISGDEEEDDEEDALIAPMAVGYYDGFIHSDLFEDFPVYFAEDAIDYQYNKKVSFFDKKLLWTQKKLKMYI